MKKHLAILRAYAAGDAFGAYYENLPPQSDIPHQMMAKAGWPLGGISDDTELTLLTIESLREENFLDLLRAATPRLRGLGPTTRHALGLPVKEEEVSQIGNTNGAMMRTALLGLYFQGSAEQDPWITRSVRCTHSSDAALENSLKMARYFAGEPLPETSWSSGSPSNDPTETHDAVVHVVRTAKSIADVYIKACQLGGDTDTVAALSGALYLLLHENEIADFEVLPWIADVLWDEFEERLIEAAKVLAHE